MFRRRCKLALLCAAALTPGCGQLFAPAGPAKGFAPVKVRPRPAAPKAGWDALARVLAAAVRADGLADADRLGARAADLDEQLGILAATGPTQTPEQFGAPEAAVAYWYNARAAWAMKLWLLAGCPAEMPRGGLCDQPFDLDGRTLTLGQIDELLAKDRDFRTVAAAPGVSLERAALPARPFEAKGIRKQIEDRFNAFVHDPKRFVIDVDSQEVRVPGMLWPFRERIVGEFNRRYGTEGATLVTALARLLAAPARRRLQDAAGYRIVEAPRPPKVRCAAE